MTAGGPSSVREPPVSATTSLDPRPAATAVTTAFQHAAGRAADYARVVHAANTRRAYATDWPARPRCRSLSGRLRPAIRTVMLGVRRTHGTAPRKATPLRTSALRDLLDTWRPPAITDGAVFHAINRHDRVATGLSDRAIALIVKRRAVAAGVDPAGYSAHSLHAGCATKAAARGVEERDIGRHTRHRSRCYAAISSRARCS